MSKTYNACVGRIYGDNKTSWTKIGKAFENSAGNITLMLDALPVSGEGGQAKITLFIDDGKNNSRSSHSSNASGYNTKSSNSIPDHADDDIPF